MAVTWSTAAWRWAKGRGVGFDAPEEGILLLAGGTIPIPTAQQFLDMGVAGVFITGAPVAEVVDFIRANAGR